MGCLWCGKYSRQCKTMPSGPPQFIPPFIPVTGMRCSYGKISSPLTEISVGKTEISETEPARPLMWTHRKFYKGFRGEARSRKPGQPGQPGSYEEALKETQPCYCASTKLRPLASGKPQTTNRKPQLRVRSFVLPRFQTLARRSVQFSSVHFYLAKIQYNTRKHIGIKVAREPRRNQKTFWSLSSPV